MKMTIDFQMIHTTAELKDLSEMFGISLLTILQNAQKKHWELRNLREAVTDLEDSDEKMDSLEFLDSELSEVNRVLGLLSALKVTPPTKKYQPTLAAIHRILSESSKKRRMLDS